MHTLELLVLRVWLAAAERPRLRERPRRRDGEAGDVPGWVMITILSAVLVVGLIAIAGPKLNDLFTTATDGVAKKSP